MPAFTAHLNLYLPGGGSLAIGGDDEPADIDKLNQNFQKIDDWADTTDGRLTTLEPLLQRNQQFTGLAAGIGLVTGMKIGDTYQETDGKKLLKRYNGTDWDKGGSTPNLAAEMALASVAIPNGAETVIGSTSPAYPYTETLDIFEWHDPTTNPTRLVPNVPGVYQVVVIGAFAVNSTGQRYFRVKKNGAAVSGATLPIATPSFSGEGTLVTEIYLNGTTDYVEVAVFQSSGGNLNFAGTVSVKLAYER